MQNLSTCLWFDHQAEEAASFYVGIFPNSRIVETIHYLEGMFRPAGTVLTVQFVLDGVEYVAMNAEPLFTFSPAISLVVYCDTQEEIDRLWERLLDGGRESRCGWLDDRFGVSWQVVPRPFLALLNAGDAAASQRAMAAMMTMTKLDIAALQRAYAGA